MILDVSEICSRIDPDLATFVHNIITLIKIAVPVVLVIFGMLDLAKGVIASKEDEIKKGQQTFIKRLIAGVIVFFMVSITQLVISLIDKESNGQFWECANKIMNGQTSQTVKKVKSQEDKMNDVEKCCNQVGGTINVGTNSKSCVVEQNKQAEYDACVNN